MSQKEKATRRNRTNNLFITDERVLLSNSNGSVQIFWYSTILLSVTKITEFFYFLYLTREFNQPSDLPLTDKPLPEREVEVLKPAARSKRHRLASPGIR